MSDESLLWAACCDITYYVRKTYYKNTQQRWEDTDSRTTDNWISCRHLSLSKQHYHHMPPCTGHSSLGIMLQISFTKTQCFLEMIYGYAYEKNLRFGQKTTAYSGRRGRCLLCRHKAQTTNKSRRWNSLGLGSSSWQLDRSYDWDETRYAGTLDISSERTDGHLKPIFKLRSLVLSDYGTVIIYMYIRSTSNAVLQTQYRHEQ